MLRGSFSTLIAKDKRLYDVGAYILEGMCLRQSQEMLDFTLDYVKGL